MSAVDGPAGDLEYLTYFSSAVERFNQPALKRLLEISRRNNATRGITGLLLYRDGRFLQFLEGPQDAARTTYEHIRMDGRHHSSRVVGTGRLKGGSSRNGGWATGIWRACELPAPRGIQSACNQTSARRMKEIRPNG
jgi:hypothetical protein